MAVVAAVAEAKQPWFWAIADAVALVLLVANLLLLFSVHLLRVRQHIRRGRERLFRQRIQAVLAELDPAREPDAAWLRSQLSGFNELNGRSSRRC